MDAPLAPPTDHAPQPPPPPKESKEMLTFEPIVISNFPQLPPPPPLLSAPNDVGGEKLTNENLLKSIGFIPGPSAVEPEVQQPSTPEEDLMSSSTEKLIQTFEMINSPGDHAPSVPRPPTGQEGCGVDIDEDDFVVIVPDCFDLDKPLADFTPPVSLAHAMENLPESSYSDSVTRSCDSHVSSVVMVSCQSADSATPAKPATPTPSCDGHVILPPACDGHVTTTLPTDPTLQSVSEADECFQVRVSSSVDPTSKPRPSTPPHEDAKTFTESGSSTSSSQGSPTANRSPLAPRRLTMRNLKGGMYLKPFAVATGIVNAVSGFVDEKIHFGSSGSGGKRICLLLWGGSYEKVRYTGSSVENSGEVQKTPCGEVPKVPCVKFSTPEASDSSDEEFEVRICLCVCSFVCIFVCLSVCP